jgi:two-component system, NarL family, invasion response regulator UvrY
MVNQRTIHIAYAEDHKIVRKGVISFLNRMVGIQVDIDVNNGSELIKAIESAQTVPDVCIIDINMPEMNGFDTLLALKEQWPDIKVLVLTVYDIEAYIVRMVMNGANGYLLKSCDPEELKTAILTVYYNGMYYNESITHQFVQDIKNKVIRLPTLSAREIQILKYCCTDMNYAQIAETIHTTTRSVEGYRDSLFRKLNVHNRVSLAMLAVQLGLVLIEMPNADSKNPVYKKTKKNIS